MEIKFSNTIIQFHVDSFQHATELCTDDGRDIVVADFTDIRGCKLNLFMSAEDSDKMVAVLGDKGERANRALGYLTDIAAQADGESYKLTPADARRILGVE